MWILDKMLCLFLPRITENIAYLLQDLFKYQQEWGCSRSEDKPETVGSHSTGRAAAPQPVGMAGMGIVTGPIDSSVIVRLAESSGGPVKIAGAFLTTGRVCHHVHSFCNWYEQTAITATTHTRDSLRMLLSYLGSRRRNLEKLYEFWGVIIT